MLRLEGRHKTNVLLFLVLIVGLGVFPLDVILPSVPSLAAALSVSSAEVALSISMFVGGVAIAQLLLGPLSDKIGRKRLLLLGLVLSALGAVGALCAKYYEAFVCYRLAQALGCGAFVIAHAIVQDVFAESERNLVRIYLTTSGGLFIAVSPLFGSLLESAFGWQGSFYVFAAVAVLAAGWATHLLDPDSVKVHDAGFFEVYEKVVTDKIFVRCALVSAIAFACHFSFIVISPLVFIDQLGLTEYEFSSVLLLYGLAYVVGGVCASWLHSRADTLLQMKLGLSLIAVSGLSLWLLSYAWPRSVFAILFPMILCSAGTTITRPVAFTRAMARFPANAGAEAAVAGTIMFLTGGAISAAITLSGDHFARTLGCGFIALSLVAFVLQRSAER